MPSGLLHVSLQGKAGERKHSLSPTPTRVPNSATGNVATFTRSAKNHRHQSTSNSSANDVHMDDGQQRHVVYTVGDKVQYHSGNFSQLATITKVHLDQGDASYYTITLEDGNEKQTVATHLSALLPQELVREAMKSALTAELVSDALASNPRVTERAAELTASKFASDAAIKQSTATMTASNIANELGNSGSFVEGVANKTASSIVNNPEFAASTSHSVSGKVTDSLLNSAPFAKDLTSKVASNLSSNFKVQEKSVGEAAIMLRDVCASSTVFMDRIRNDAAKSLASDSSLQTLTTNMAATALSTSLPNSQVFVDNTVNSLLQSGQFSGTIASKILSDESFISKTSENLVESLNALKDRVDKLDLAPGSTVRKMDIENALKPLEEKLMNMMNIGGGTQHLLNEVNILKEKANGEESYSRERTDLKKRLEEMMTLSGSAGTDITSLENQVKFEITNLGSKVETEIKNILSRITPLETNRESNMSFTISWPIIYTHSFSSFSKTQP